MQKAVHAFHDACPDLTAPAAPCLVERLRSDHFRHCFSQVRAAAAHDVPSVAGCWFRDLRDTAVTRLGEAECTILETCAITGHSIQACHTVLKHDLALTPDMADSAIAKLIAYEDRKNGQATDVGLSDADSQSQRLSPRFVVGAQGLEPWTR